MRCNIRTASINDRAPPRSHRKAASSRASRGPLPSSAFVGGETNTGTGTAAHSQHLSCLNICCLTVAASTTAAVAFPSRPNPGSIALLKTCKRALREEASRRFTALDTIILSPPELACIVVLPPQAASLDRVFAREIRLFILVFLRKESGRANFGRTQLSLLQLWDLEGQRDIASYSTVGTR